MRLASMLMGLLLCLCLTARITRTEAAGKKGNRNGRIVIDVFRPACLTASNLAGHCVAMSECAVLSSNPNPALIRNSLCFRLFFIPGVCCPNDEVTTSAATTLASSSTGLLPWNATPDATKETADPFITSRDGCGKNVVFTMRVVGGDATYAGQWPWMAAIFVQTRRRKEYWCGGTLINSQYVMTAAHCLKDAKQRTFPARQLSVRLGSYDLKDSSSAIELGVRSMKLHPNFRINGFYNDIAVLKLDEPLSFSDYIKPICLPDKNAKDEDLVGEFGTITGWGATFYSGRESSLLRQTELPIWHNADCDRVFAQKIEKIFMCAGLADGGKDACQGDSGSPFMLNRDGRWVQYGIVSFGEKCAQAGSPGVYTRLTEFLDWIKDNTT